MISLNERTKNFALNTLELLQFVPYNFRTAILCKQLARSSTSIGANYRSAMRGRSKAEFIAKISIAREEADECCYWIELLMNIEKTYKERFEVLLKEANEITAILTASVKTEQTNK